MAATCSARELLQHVTSRWGILALIALESGTQRFSELRRKINGVSELSFHTATSSSCASTPPLFCMKRRRRSL
ncbi:winged helix-turn-helix transcriptional regulator [Halomonas sp. EGI 63088]|uniref:Winged helix-turn-helix transcriptional regulator n=1 Tax=Halomonas flagellata TaxID=2920385 RepID=A0ABS9RRQ0_9GAMM|nr:winged helix-turn-helix transcriptional regulator [Halomonas flagellata]MCH4562515.1 winged helix-turn-helix transcriptional regulator [Halomonas flagellata]